MSQLVLISTNENPNSCNKWIHPQTEKLNIWNYFENNLQTMEERKSAIHKVKTVLQQRHVSHMKNRETHQQHNLHQNIRQVVKAEVLKAARCALQRCLKR